MGDKLNEWIEANSATLQALSGPGQPGIPPSAMPGMPDVPVPPQPGFPPTGAPAPGGFPPAGAGPEQFMQQASGGPPPQQAGSVMAQAFPTPRGDPGSFPGATPPIQAPPVAAPPVAPGPQAMPVEVAGPTPGQPPPAAAPKPKPKKPGMGFDQVMKDADPKQIDDAIKVMETASGKSIEELYTAQTGAPPPEGMGKRKLGQALFEFGLNLMSAPAGLSDVETIGRAGQATIAGRRQREEKEEAKALAAQERRAAAEERRMGRMDKKFDRASTLKRLEIEQMRVQATLDKNVGPFNEYVSKDDGYLYSYDSSTGESRQVLHNGKPQRPDEEHLKNDQTRFVWEAKRSGYLDVFGKDSTGAPLTGAEMRQAREDALAYANSGRQLEESEARIEADKIVAGILEKDSNYKYIDDPEEQERIRNRMVQERVDFYMVRADTLGGGKPDESKLAEGVVTPLKDSETGVVEYWTLDKEGNRKQIPEEQVIKQ